MDAVRTLLADDHAVVRAGIRNALEDMPALTIIGEVDDGPSLMAALAELQPDLLLIDVTMPDFEPIAAIRRIHAHYPQLLILVISAYDDDVYVQGLLSAGVNGYHLKDQSLGDLRLAVERVLNGKRWVSSPLLEKLLRPSSPSATIPTLTTRQLDVLHLLIEGMDNRSIANKLDLSIKTIENHLTRLYRQLNVQSRLQAVHYVRQHPELLAQGQQGQQKEREATLDVAPPSVEQLTILLVDDNKRYRGQLRRMIGKGYPQAMIYEADNTTEALQLTQHVTPKMAFVDVVLGDEDGIRCTRRIKTELPSSRVVLISAYPDREFHRRGLEAGATAFVDKKDLDAATLHQIINDILT